jgi:hypothetical protein
LTDEAAAARRRPQPVSAKALALGLPADGWKAVTWRGGSTGPVTSCCARVRVRAAHRDHWLPEPRAEEWLLKEWPGGEKEPTEDWLSTLANHISMDRIAELAKLRWRIERDCQELKQELGLGHYQGRGWRGFYPSRHALHRRLPFPDLRTEDDSRLGPAVAPKLQKPSLPVTEPEAPPIRPERHVANSIATLRRRLIGALAQALDRCPCCQIRQQSKRIPRDL